MRNMSSKGSPSLDAKLSAMVSRINSATVSLFTWARCPCMSSHLRAAMSLSQQVDDSNTYSADSNLIFVSEAGASPEEKKTDHFAFFLVNSASL